MRYKSGHHPHKGHQGKQSATPPVSLAERIVWAQNALETAVTHWVDGRRAANFDLSLAMAVESRSDELKELRAANDRLAIERSRPGQRKTA